MTPKERRERFRAWALKQPKQSGAGAYADSTVNGYCNFISKIGEKYPNAIDADYPSNLFECDDKALISALYDAIKNPGNADSDDWSSLNLYLCFLESTESDGKDALDELIEEYAGVFEDFRASELYKWRAVKCFKENWDPNAAEFADMLEKAFAESGNLLAGSNYLPSGMLKEFARVNPEETRSALVDTLFDEETDLIERMKQFDILSQHLLDELNEVRAAKGEEPAKSAYQDVRAMNVYLAFAHPELHYLYKAGMLWSAAERLGIKTSSDKYQRVVEYRAMCDRILNRLSAKYPEVIEKSDSLLPEGLRGIDPAHHLLVQDIIYYVNAYSVEYSWFPTPSEYDPEISSAEWQELLEDPTITSGNSLIALKCFQAFSDGATCTEVANKYGRPKNFYLNGIVSLARRVHARTGCSMSPRDEDGKDRFWTLLCIGKNAAKGQADEFVWKLRDELLEAMEEIDLSSVPQYANGEEEEVKQKTQVGSNIILYGPPGTGKTYNVPAMAWLISRGIDATLEDIRRLSDEERSEAKAWYDAQLRDRENGQVAFTTFHQSYGYEEFIEGIRPVIPEEDDSGVEGDLGYTYEDGVFKAFCKRASKPIAIDKTKHFGFNEDPTVWKVSLGGTGDNPVRRECLENDHIRIGWDSYGPDVTDETDFSINGGKTVLTAFATKMRIGDIVLSCYSATTVDAIGVVIGEVEWRDEHDHFKRQRDVKWIAKGIAFDIVEEFGLPTMTLSTVYRLKLDEADVLKIIEQTGGEDLRMTVPNDKPYIFIIDEINRGNISKVFGELITLIEPSKRAGQPGQQSAILPYTKRPFSVPANVTIIGTMNTADRSIALMDTALRRRFRFVEMMPDYEALDGIGEVDGVDVSKMVRRINQRIDVLYDREHEIGHAYFMELKDDPTIGKLSAIFEERVIPLLQEYFYDNYEKICLVLGDNQKTGDMPRFFAEDKTITAEELFGDSDVSYEDVHDYRLNSGALADPQVYIGVYEQA